MQTINRHNYEEFFLLYLDDELNVQEKLEVENFIRQNADLAVEFEMLMSTKFPAEKIVFNDKETLLRTEGDSINETNYEEYFLLYIDNELSAAKREEVETYVLQHPKLQDEFTTLKQTVLTPEAIGYGDKQDLYRAEKRRTIYLKPWRLAAAAIFIGVCAVGIWMMQQPEVKAPVAKTDPVQNESAENMVAAKPVDTIEQQTKQQPEIILTQASPSTGKVVAKKAKGNIIVDKDEDLNNRQQNVAIQPRVIQHTDIVVQQKEPPVEMPELANVPENLDQMQNDVAVLRSPMNTDESNNDFKVYPVAYKEININDDDRSLYIGMLDLNKDKVKTLFKKAGRIFGNKQNNLSNEDGKLQVANFEIDTKRQ